MFGDEEIIQQSKNQPQKEARLQQLENYHFDTMDFMTECGFNLLVFGHGSKLAFLRSYRERKLASKAVVWVNAFHSAVSMKGLLNRVASFCFSNCKVLETALAEAKKFPSMHQQVDFLAHTLQRNPPTFGKLYLFINSLDSSKLREPEYLGYLAKLAQVEHIRLIVSVDNIRAGSLFDESLLNSFNFYCANVDTFMDYDIEEEYSEPLFKSKQETTELGLSFIFSSMTKTQ